MVAAGPAAQQDAQAGLELADELTLGRDIAFSNSARQLAAWNKIHTLFDPETLLSTWNTRRGILPCPAGVSCRPAKSGKQGCKRLTTAPATAARCASKRTSTSPSRPFAAIARSARAIASGPRWSSRRVPAAGGRQELTQYLFNSMQNEHLLLQDLRRAALWPRPQPRGR